MPIKRRLVSVSQAAEHLSCSAKTVRRRIADGTLTGYRVGSRLIRVDLNEVDQLLEPIPSATPHSSGGAA